jgi:hypothetical protein
MIDKGLSERRALAVVRMSASAYRYQPAPERNVELRERILALAQRSKWHGVAMIYLRFRQWECSLTASAWNGCTRKQSCRCDARNERRCQWVSGSCSCGQIGQTNLLAGDTRDTLMVARGSAKAMYRKNYRSKKAGVGLVHLCAPPWSKGISSRKRPQSRKTHDGDGPGQQASRKGGCGLGRHRLQK